MLFTKIIDVGFEFSSDKVFLSFPEPQREAIFLGRPQRFLAGILFADGVEELAYCANSGSMSRDLQAGSQALVWDSADSKRTRRYTLRAVKFENVWVGIDTHLSNRIVEKALEQKLIPGLEIYDSYACEHNLGSGVRIDFLLRRGANECLVEVKSAMIVEDGIARYPDSVTPRGVKQLKALTFQAAQGKRAVLLFLVQRSDACSFVVTNSFDNAYALAFDEAIAAGVEVITLCVTVSRAGFSNPRLLPYGQETLSSVATTCIYQK